VILHGGEPLLAGPARLKEIARILRLAVAGVSISMQTNGVLLPRMLPTLAECGIAVGVSVDGTAQAHDQHRVLADGRGTHAAAAEGLRQLRSPAYRHLYRGLLCVINIGAGPLETYQALLEHRPPAIDLLLPYASHQHPPAGDPGAYADWLIPIFDAWYREQAPVRLRLFDEILHLVLRPGDSRTGFIGPVQLSAMVIESDGEIEMVDALKSCYEGAASTGCTVATDSLARAEYVQLGYAARMGISSLCAQCQACRARGQCGGGYFVQRWDGKSFLNPSVYCAAMLRLVDYISERVASDAMITTGEKT
jgi:uncharacterized protein